MLELLSKFSFSGPVPMHIDLSLYNLNLNRSELCLILSLPINRFIISGSQIISIRKEITFKDYLTPSVPHRQFLTVTSLTAFFAPSVFQNFSTKNVD